MLDDFDADHDWANMHHQRRDLDGSGVIVESERRTKTLDRRHGCVGFALELHPDFDHHCEERVLEECF